MAQMIFLLKDVPEAESDAVRVLLDDAGIVYYETFAGRWNISVPALWVTDDNDFAPARTLINAYQETLLKTIAAEKQQLADNGQTPTFWQSLISRPATGLFFLAAIAVVLGLSILPFFSFS